MFATINHNKYTQIHNQHLRKCKYIWNIETYDIWKTYKCIHDRYIWIHILAGASSKQNWARYDNHQLEWPAPLTRATSEGPCIGVWMDWIRRKCRGLKDAEYYHVLSSCRKVENESYMNDGQQSRCFCNGALRLGCRLLRCCNVSAHALCPPEPTFNKTFLAKPCWVFLWKVVGEVHWHKVPLPRLQTLKHKCT